MHHSFLITPVLLWVAPHVLPCRHGKQLPENEDPNLAKYRERFFNFYDSRIMDMAW